MRIGFDARYVFAEPLSAHAMLFRQIFVANALQPVLHTLYLYTDKSTHQLGTLAAPNVVLRVIQAPKAPLKDLRWLNFLLPASLKSDAIDVFLTCFYKTPLAARVPCINMLHDISFFRLPRRQLNDRQRSLTYRILLWLNIRAHCLRATRVITVSQYSQSAIGTTMLLKKSKIAVCYNPVDQVFRERSNESSDQNSSYCLFVGSSIPKKNILGMLTAYARLPEALRAQFPLLIRTDHTEQYLNAVDVLGLSTNIKFIGGHLSLRGLKALTAGATVVVLLSYDEGFGLPIAEAMTCGSAVLVSNRGSLPEITDCTEVCVNPDDPDEVSRIWRKLLVDHEFRSNVRLRLQNSATRFVPQEIMNTFFNILSSAVTTHPQQP